MTSLTKSEEVDVRGRNEWHGNGFTGGEVTVVRRKLQAQVVTIGDGGEVTRLQTEQLLSSHARSSYDYLTCFHRVTLNDAVYMLRTLLSVATAIRMRVASAESVSSITNRHR